MKLRNGPFLLRGFSFALIVAFASGFAMADDRAPGTLRVWVFADAHVGTDQRNGRESLATAMRQSESAAGFDWDIWLLTFIDGSDEVRAQCYLHADDYAPQGWYDKVASTIKLPAPIKMPAGKP